jgi:L-threonylcarbamoyladenylate synthase
MKAEIEQSAKILMQSGIILYPTDTIWGIGCLATDAIAIQKIKKLKNRPPEKSMIILVESEKRLQDLVQVPEVVWDIIDLEIKPITIVYDNPKGVDKSLIASDNTLAIRLTKDLFCRDLIRKINAPLVSTSANVSGKESPQSFSEIQPNIIKGVDFVINLRQNEVAKYPASSIIQVSSNGSVKVIRH